MITVHSPGHYITLEQHFRICTSTRTRLALWEDHTTSDCYILLGNCLRWLHCFWKKFELELKAIILHEGLFPVNNASWMSKSIFIIMIFSGPELQETTR